jgi:hypothetical protein
MKHLILDAPGYRLEAITTYHPITGTSLELYSTWPTANHPEPHRMITLTLPPESFANLAKVLETLSQPAPLESQETTISFLEERLRAIVDPDGRIEER